MVDDNRDNLESILSKLDMLSQQQQLVQNEIAALRQNVSFLMQRENERTTVSDVSSTHLSQSVQSDLPATVSSTPAASSIDSSESTPKNATSETEQQTSVPPLVSSVASDRPVSTSAPSDKQTPQNEVRSTAFSDLLKTAPEHTSASTSMGVKAKVQEALRAGGSTDAPSVESETASVGAAKPIRAPKAPSNLEKFIGENLLNKVGIAITVIGVGIGAKYAIDHDMISPLTRIILGYLVGVALFTVASRLKKDYEAFSAVLLSGSLAIFYFISYAAYAFYALMPQLIAFAVMLMFTVFTVVASIRYNRQIIALIGLVGAYAVPLLLSDGSGHVEVLFSYMCVINCGILILAFVRDWKILKISSFVISWTLYLVWYAESYNPSLHFGIALTFAFAFFLIFYGAILAYKLIKSAVYDVIDVLLILANSFVFYGLGYALIEHNLSTTELLGVYTLGNALIHFVVSIVVYKRKLVDKNLQYLVSGLVLVFITVTIPVQFNGMWVTYLWAAESVLLLWIGMKQKVLFYERIAYAVLVAAFISQIHDWRQLRFEAHAQNWYAVAWVSEAVVMLWIAIRHKIRFYELMSYMVLFVAFCTQLHDWEYLYYDYQRSNPASYVTLIFNTYFLASLCVVTGFAYVRILLERQKRHTDYVPGRFDPILAVVIPAATLCLAYFSVYVEIDNYWNQEFVNSQTSEHYGDWNIQYFNVVVLLSYTALFVTGLSVYGVWRRVSKAIATSFVVLNGIALIAICTQGLYSLDSLRVEFIYHDVSNFYAVSNSFLTVRYVLFACTAVLLFFHRRFVLQSFEEKKMRIGSSISLHLIVLVILSNELIHWQQLWHVERSSTFGLSIAWGLYSLFLIALGIRSKQKHIRLLAITLFGLTLLKLFLYDISELDTIGKTIAFVGLGILLLVISFLYNKYKSLIFEE